MATKNNNSQLVYSVDEVLAMLLRKDTTGAIVVSDMDEIKQFNKYGSHLSGNVSIIEEDTSADFHDLQTDTWSIPDEYLAIDVDSYLLGRCENEEQYNRVELELKEFKQRDLSVVLNLMIYLVDYFTENNIVWGVGRGSSAASFCLYLIGINRVNSLEYDLDIKEFFK